MTVRAKTKITRGVALPDKAEASGHGSGMQARVHAPREVEYRGAARLDGVLMQLAENGRVLRLDKTDQAYRVCCWRRLGLRGKAKAWPIIFSLVRFLPRRFVAYVLYAAAADWLVLKNESLKLAFASLANNHFTIAEAQGVLNQLETSILLNQLEVNALRIAAWQHFLGTGEVDAQEELARARQRSRELARE